MKGKHVFQTLCFLYVPFCMLLPCTASAENVEDAKKEGTPSLQYVYTPDRKNVPAESATGSLYVVDKQEIEKKNQPSLHEDLREVPGTNTYQSGTLGEDVSVSIRGLSSNQTLILYEGIKLNSIFDQSFDFGSMTNFGVSSIEVLRGPQSSMYGSEAIGGVVNIFSQEGEKDGFEVFFKGGNLRTLYEGISRQGKEEKFSYNLGFSRMDSKGNGRRDAFTGNYFFANAAIEPSKDINIKVVSTYIDSKKALPYDVAFVTTPEPSLQFVEDSNRLYKSDFFFTTAVLNHSPARLWDYTLQGGFLWENVELDNPPDDSLSNVEFSNIDSFRTTFINQHNVKVTSIYSISLGYEFTHETISAFLADDYPPTYEEDSMQPRMDHGLYFQNYLNFGRTFRAKAGLRYDHITSFGNVISPRASFGYYVKDLQVDLTANYGEGFRAPTYRELFLPEIGNPDLNEERSRSFDVGVKKNLLSDLVSLEVIYFHNFIKDLIVFTESLIYENVSTAQTYGGEALITVKPAKIFTGKLAYTYTRAVDTSDGGKTPLPYIPENRLNVNLDLKPLDELDVNLNVHFITNQPNIAAGLPIYDVDGIELGEKNPGFVKVDLAASYQLLKNKWFFKDLTLDFVINNLLNREIFDLAGLKTAGINFLLGFKAFI